MSRITHLDHLRSELKTVEFLINDASSGGDVVAEMNFRSRVDAIREELQVLERTDANVGEVALLFDGRPVQGQRSIDANFATKALKLFQDIVSKLYAVGSAKGLEGSRGKIPGAGLSALRITDLARGSFGFVLEEGNTEQSSVMQTAAREAMDIAVSTMSELSQIDEDAFNVELDQINPRVFSAFQNFIGHLHNSEASLRTALPDRANTYSFDDIARAHRRLSETKINIEVTYLKGKLIGLTPVDRMFNFAPDESVVILTGKFDQQISQDYLERIEKEGVLLGSRFGIELETTTIRKPNGSISITYIALEFEELEEPDSKT